MAAMTMRRARARERHQHCSGG